MESLYIITDGEKYKIGYSKDVANRKRQLQTANGSLLDIVFEFETVHGMKLERSIQRSMKHKNIIGEWFDLEKEDIAKIKELCILQEKNFNIIKKNETENSYVRGLY
ncbi:MAG: GIY-YIG nuclease family protein [Candidatus Pacearchaeota archaeon]|jgi:hypothetical protein|nr:GIY-YIG nuclease family protein [Clostridia bacterium]